jgi:hypothetical protein
MKLSHIAIRRIIKRAEKPLNKEAILFRWTDSYKPLNLQKDLDEMVKIGILNNPVNGYYQLVPKPTPAP